MRNRKKLLNQKCKSFTRKINRKSFTREPVPPVGGTVQGYALPEWNPEGQEAAAIRRRSFTLIELMLVVIIVGVLAAMVMPRLVGRSEQARIAVAKADVDSNLATILDLYEMDVGRYPNALSDLKIDPGVAGWKGPYLKKSSKDPWGREYEYSLEASEGKDYKLCSKGQDEAQTDDDICN